MKTINAGSVTLNENGTFTLVEPATVLFINEWDEQFGGTLDGDRFTLIEAGHSYLYER